MSIQTGMDARQKTRRRREKRTDAVLDIPANERVTVECPECRDSWEVLIATRDAAEYPPSFGNCSNWDCDVFLKYRVEATESEPTTSRPTQTGLGQFAGGESA